MLSKNPVERTSAGPARALTLSETKQLISQYSQSEFTPEKRNSLHLDLNKAISVFQFRQSYAAAPTPVQFRKPFDNLLAALKRLKGKLPPIDQQNGLFNYIRLLGEAYAVANGPHPNIEPRNLPSLSGAFDLGDDEPPDFNSAQRLRELIDSVDQVSSWMEAYDKDLVPKVGWSKLEKRYSRTHSPELWLVGKQLPAVFDKYFGHLKRGRKARGASGSHCDNFVVSVLNYAGIKTNRNDPYAPDTVEKYRRRARKPEGFELTADKLD